MKRICGLVILIFVLSSMSLFAQHEGEAHQEHTVVKDPDRLAVLWTSGDPDVAKKMVFLYTYNAKRAKWFKTVRFIIWGASTKLLSEDKELQDTLKKMKDVGIELFACKWCADSYGVSEQLEKMGVTVIYYGKPLSQLIKDGWNILTF